MRRAVLISLAVLLLLSGCAQLKGAGANAPRPPRRPGLHPGYLEFPDILIPGELERVSKECFITNGFGRLVVSGRVQSESPGPVLYYLNEF